MWKSYLFLYSVFHKDKLTTKRLEKTCPLSLKLSFPSGSDGKSVYSQFRRPRLDPWVRKIPWRRKWQPTPVFLPGKFHGWRRLVGDCGVVKSRTWLRDFTFTFIPETTLNSLEKWSWVKQSHYPLVLGVELHLQMHVNIIKIHFSKDIMRANYVQTLCVAQNLSRQCSFPCRTYYLLWERDRNQISKCMISVCVFYF